MGGIGDIIPPLQRLYSISCCGGCKCNREGENWNVSKSKSNRKTHGWQRHSEEERERENNGERSNGKPLFINSWKDGFIGITDVGQLALHMWVLSYISVFFGFLFTQKMLLLREQFYLFFFQF